MLLVLSLCFITSVFAGTPSLSDPLGLYEEAPFKFGTGEDYVSGTVWPKPQQEAREDVYFSLDPSSFQFSITGQSSDVLKEALVRYNSLTFPDTRVHREPSLAPLNSLEINVKGQIQPMDLEMDESYVLVVNAPTSSLSANTPWGALRGLETFSQVVYQNEAGFYYAQKNKIVDFPRFHHRGFLIDTSRHYVAMDVILQFIDALAYSKYNVLHWHIVDDQSFPFVSQDFPSLHQKGAWNNETHIYTPSDVQNVISYARLRGIRVIPEFDTPGHTQSWASIPNLLTPCYSGGKPNGNYGPINPIVESNYDFLEKFFREVAGVFPDQYLHLGGDEVSFSCWQSNPDISKWMDAHGMGQNYSMLEQYYEQRLLDIVAKLGKNYVIWQEVIDNQVKVKNNTVVNIWKGHGDEWKAEAKTVTQLGYDVILSSPWYLNYISYGPDWPNVKADTVVNVWKGGWQNEMNRVTSLGYRSILSSCWYLNYISYGPDWPNYYKCDPQNFDGTEEQKKRVIVALLACGVNG